MELPILQPPQSVRGMTKLDKDAFRTSVTFPVIEIDTDDIKTITRRVRLEQFLIGHKLKPLKNFMDLDSENLKKNKKLMIFHPDKVQEKEQAQILDLLKKELPSKSLEFTELQRELTFDNWDAKSIFKAVLPVEYSSYTQTGHIIHCNFADETLPYRFVIAEVLLEKVNNCRTVVQKGNIITNVFRNLDLELLAGEEQYVTEVKESGLRFKMDFSKVYWNSRLSHEHERVAQLFNSESLVYDACCGIGPFVLPALRRKPKRIFANDLNPDSVKWLRENLRINRIPDGKVEVFNMDANLFIRQKVSEDVRALMAQRATSSEDPEEDGPVRPEPEIHVVMNLPAYAVNFLPAFRGILRKFKEEIEKIPEGKRWKWNVYCYLFAKSHVDVPDDWYETEARRMCDEKTNFEGKSFVKYCHNVRTVSSRKEMFCAQLELPYEYLLAEPVDDVAVEMEAESTDEPQSKKKKTEN